MVNGIGIKLINSNQQNNKEIDVVQLMKLFKYNMITAVVTVRSPRANALELLSFHIFEG